MGHTKGEWTLTPSNQVTIEDGAVTLSDGIVVSDAYYSDRIDFSDPTLSITDYGSQTASVDGKTPYYDVLDDGATLLLENNMWRAVDFQYSFTANTIIEFDYFSSVEGEVHAFGFDNDLNLDSNRIVRLHGDQTSATWHDADPVDYDVSSALPRHYKINIGSFYTGNSEYLFFGADNDDIPGTGNAIFSNVRVYESGDENSAITHVHVRAHGGDDVVTTDSDDQTQLMAFGGTGDDDLLGGDAYSNMLHGGEGDDIYRTAVGSVNDVFFEDDGDDEYVFTENTTGQALIVVDSGGAAGGNDTIDFSALSSGVGAILDSSLTQDLLGDSSLSLYLDNGVNPVLIENIIGTSFDDNLQGNSLDNLIDAGPGMDTVHGHGGNDTIFGSSGNDTIHGNEGDDYLVGGEDIDTIFGGDGLDEILGGLGDDILNGGDQEDTIEGGPGADTYDVTLGDEYEADLYIDYDGTPDISSGGVTNIRPAFVDAPSYASLTVDEEYSITFNVDAGEVGQNITYSLIGDPLPAGATFTNGTFTWTPTAVDEGTNFTLAIKATDDGSPALSASQTLRLSVGSIELAPVEYFVSHPRSYSGSGVYQQLVWNLPIEQGITHGYHWLIEERQSNAPESAPWRTIHDATISNDVGIYTQSFNINQQELDYYGSGNFLGQEFDYRIKYSDTAAGISSDYFYTSALLSPGEAEVFFGDYFFGINDPNPLTPPNQIVMDYYVTPGDNPIVPDYYLIEELNGDIWSPIELIDSSISNAYTETRSPSQFPDGWRVRALSGQASTVISSVSSPYTDIAHAGDNVNLGAEGLVGVYRKSLPAGSSFYIGTNNDYDSDKYEETTAIENFLNRPTIGEDPVVDSVPNQNDVVVLSKRGLFDDEIYQISNNTGLWNADEASFTYTSGINVIKRIASSQLDTNIGEVLGNGGIITFPDSHVYVQGITPSLTKGDQLLTVQQTSGSDVTTYDYNFTTVDIDLEIGGLNNLQEHQIGAFIQTNSDFSKGLEENGTPIPDNRRDPATGDWVFDATNTEVMTPATLSWNADVHEDLDIVLTYPSDVLVWIVDANGENGVLLESGVPLTSPQDGLDLRIEGLNRSSSIANSSITAKFVDPNNLLSVVDTDEAKYTVLDFNLLVDGDRDGVFEDDDAADRQLYHWYNTDADYYRATGKSFASTLQSATVPLDGESFHNNLSIPSDVASLENGVIRNAYDSTIQSIQDLEDFAALLLKTDQLLESLPEGVSLEYYVTVDSSLEDSTAINLFDGRGNGGIIDPHDHLFGENSDAYSVDLYGGVPRHGLTHLDYGYLGADAILEGSTSHSKVTEQILDNDLINLQGNSLFLFEAAPHDDSANNILHKYSSDSLDYTFNLDISILGDKKFTHETKIDLELYDIIDFFDTYQSTVTNEQILDTRAPLESSELVNDGAVLNEAGGPLNSDSDTVIFIHGWNNTNEWKKATSETAFKRLYHQGYKGRFVHFNWPTQVGTLTYNTSDFIAYKSGSVLKELIESFHVEMGANAADKLTIYAHSMGNVVASEALRLWEVENPNQSAVANYVASNAAVSADAYGAAVTDPETQNYYHSYPAHKNNPNGSHMFANSTAAATNWFNYYLHNDFALTEAWELNDATKGLGGEVVSDPNPHRYAMRTLGSIEYPVRREIVSPGVLIPNIQGIGSTYRPAIREDVLLFTQQTIGGDMKDTYEILAYLASSENRPFGSQQMNGRFTDRSITSLGLAPTLPGSSDTANHSFQFLYGINRTKDYWSSVVADASFTTTR